MRYVGGIYYILLSKENDKLSFAKKGLYNGEGGRKTVQLFLFFAGNNAAVGRPNRLNETVFGQVGIISPKAEIYPPNKTPQLVYI